MVSELNIPERVDHNYLSIGINDDDPLDDIIRIVPECMNFIHDNISSGVLVHCLEGKSRSVCIVLLYLKLYHNIDIDESVITLAKHRDVDIYPLYLSQIKLYSIRFNC